jgi:hypothetical protein
MGVDDSIVAGDGPGSGTGGQGAKMRTQKYAFFSFCVSMTDGHKIRPNSPQNDAQRTQLVCLSMGWVWTIQSWLVIGLEVVLGVKRAKNAHTKICVFQFLCFDEKWTQDST